MNIIEEIEKKIAMLEMRIEALEYRPRICSCKCHEPGGQKFDRREVDTFSTNLHHIAVPCCDCPIQLRAK